MVGCVRHQRGDPPAVSSLRFEESTDGLRWVRGTSDFHLRQAIRQGVSPQGAFWVPWIDPVALNTAQLAEDAWRVEVWYAHHGFFDARFQGWAFQPTRWHGDGTPKRVEVIGHVREGRPSLVRDIRFEGIEGMGAYVQHLMQRADVEEGERFSLESHNSTISETQSFLWEQGFARARVSGEVEVYPMDHAVDLTYKVDGVGPGEVCTFGEIRIEDTAGVPEILVREAIAFQPGETYSTRKLDESQVRLFALGAFSVVRLSPELSRSSTVIPIEVQLAPAKTREVKLGFGLGLESGEQELRASSEFRHGNLRSRLWQADALVSAGYKTFGALKDVTNEPQDEWKEGGPFARVEASLSIPRVVGRGSRFRQSFEVEQGLEEASSFFRWAIRPTLSFLVRDSLSLSTGYRLEHWVGDLDDELLSVEGTEALLEDYRVSALEQTLLLDLRDSKIQTRRGLYAEGKFTEAGLITGFRFWKAEADFRRFWPIERPSGVLSIRLAGAAAAPHAVLGGQDDGRSYVPYAERFLLGGSNSVRGWEADHLGPLVCSDSGECVPRGALASLFSTLQWRVEGPYSIAGVAFVDTGMAWETLQSVRLSELQPSTGFGLRYGTPVGPLRIDFAWRLRDPEWASSTSNWALHAGLGEVF
ncbi:MAG: BamA/TamA family outer membrane protein [Myxococcota bacterium]|nr:BamA/TamA family outer membrane protein [Myxococcota bacterium]